MTLEDRINRYYDHLTHTDKQILKVILKLDFKRQNYTVNDIANHAHVSTTSVHRAIKKVGFKAYTEFKYEVQKRTGFVESNGSNYNDNIIESITRTLNDFTETNHDELYEKMNKARTIYAFGTGNEQQSALQIFANHFIYYGKPIIIINTITDLEIYSRKMTEDDLIFFCSLNGNAISYQNVLNTLGLKNTYSVSITLKANNNLSQSCKHNLFFYPDFHQSNTTLHWPSLTLRVLLDALLNDYFLHLSHQN